MRPVTEPGKFASWIAPPRVGIDNKPGDFDTSRSPPETHAARAPQDEETNIGD